MALTSYCDQAEVRAALGVNSNELSDTVLALPVYEIGLLRELTKVSTSLPAAFSTVRQVDEADRTALQASLYNAVRMFSVYSVARQVGVSLPTFAPKDVGDGKASLSRFSGAPYEATMDQIKQFLADARDALADAIAEYEGGAAPAEPGPAVFFMASPRGVDPVTGA